MTKLTANPARASKVTAAAPVTVVALPTAPAAAATATTSNVPALLAYVVVAHNIRTTGVGASVARKAAGYAVGRTIQECRAAGITAADIRWDMQRNNITVAAPATPAAVAAAAATPEAAAVIAAALPALQAAQAAAVLARTYTPAAVA